MIHVHVHCVSTSLLAKCLQPLSTVFIHMYIKLEQLYIHGNTWNIVATHVYCIPMFVCVYMIHVCDNVFATAF